MKPTAALFAFLVVPGLAACAQEPPPPPEASPAGAAAPLATAPPTEPVPATAPESQQPSPASPAADADAAPTLVVHKTPWCGCCRLWAEQAAQAGFEVEVRETEDLSPLKQALGIPQAHASCHTAEVDGYVVEGHVPFEDVRRLLAERPDARGLAVPGMPLGSPGMETPDGRVQPYDVLLIGNDGSASVYASHGEE